MSRYKAYAEYKDSGVEWLGLVPQHWKTCSLRWFIDIASGDGLSNTDFDKAEDDVNKYRVIGGNGTLGYTSLINTVSKSFAIGRVGALCGNVHFLDETCWITDNALKLSTWRNFQDSYFLHLLVAARINEYASRSAQPLITGEQIKALRVVMPTIDEQEKIANFLDHETAKIDTLIAKQQGLIKLLKEKRQAVISHAVTKGLNPNAPMRDSGVEWLGEVPAHWVVSKFGYISMVVRGGAPRPAGDPLLFNGDYSPWVTVAEITKDDEVYLTSTESFLTKLGSEQCRVFSAGTLLISNSGATLGVPKILTINANANDGVVGFECLSLNHEFAYFYLSTITDDLRERIKQGSGLKWPPKSRQLFKEFKIVPVSATAAR
ncbi:restriction endonuclease subunit S, partial [Undibacterium sp. CCC2.1]|uniref:restriction endonuclease subunit S n=1 Tax=unclassified Undibacterium TaxID=2630295 RepID=UPI002B22C920